MRRWLADAGFRTEAAAAVRFWAQEVYGDIRAWGVTDESRMTRTQQLIDYVMHPLLLARAGGERTSAAEAFLRRTFLPLGNAAWKWSSGFGFTQVDHLVMRHFLSEQVHAIRLEAGTLPAEGPSGRLGFAWAPENGARSRSSVRRQDRRVQPGSASALPSYTRQGRSSQRGACGPPGDHDWCEGAFEGAAFNDGWSAFSSWEG